MSLSNQYPRLQWALEPDATSKPAYVARPHGPDAGWARVYLQRTDLNGQWWSWTAYWPERFQARGMLYSKQAAADAATVGYWDGMAATEDWKPALPVTVRQHTPILPEMRFYAWVDSLVATMTDDNGPSLVRQFFLATRHGQSIAGNADADRWAHNRLSQAFGTRSYRKEPFRH